MATYKPVTDKAGNVKMVLVRERLPVRGEHHLATLPFNERVKRAFYGLECEHGARWNKSREYSNQTLKQVWCDEAR